MKTHIHKPEPVARTIASSTGQRQADLPTVMQAFRNNTTQLNIMEEENDESLQGKFITQRAAVDEDKLMQRKSENHTGLPDDLKNGVENLSGFSMNDVRVHYNSHKPAQLQAHAYAQGTDIHLAPGQEKHLPHEAWHVVQQMQGRVQPTMQLQGMKVNTDEGLEREADVMGERAVTDYSKYDSSFSSPWILSHHTNNSPIQGNWWARFSPLIAAAGIGASFIPGAAPALSLISGLLDAGKSGYKAIKTLNTERHKIPSGSVVNIANCKGTVDGGTLNIATNTITSGGKCIANLEVSTASLLDCSNNITTEGKCDRGLRTLQTGFTSLGGLTGMASSIADWSGGNTSLVDILTGGSATGYIAGNVSLE